MSAPEPGLRRQVMSYSPAMMLVRHLMIKGWVGTRHIHPHEQMVYIVRGHICFEHPGGVFDVSSGDSFLVPGNVEHQASALEDSEVFDIFTRCVKTMPVSRFKFVSALTKCGLQRSEELRFLHSIPLILRMTSTLRLAKSAPITDPQ
jgi:quercetin dioxygenase-like cupin family protein